MCPPRQGEPASMPYVWFLLICSIWGSSFILMKRAAICLSPTAISAGRVGFGALVVGLLYWRMRQRGHFRRQDLFPLAAVVLVGFVWPYTAQPWLIAKHQNSAFIGMTVAFTPLLTLLVSAVVLKTLPTPRQMIGVMGALFCLSLLMWDGWRQSLPAADLALAISVPLGYALCNVWTRKWLTHLPTHELSLYCLAGSATVLVPAALCSAAPDTFTPTQLPWSWGAVAILGMLGTGLSTFLFIRLIQEQGPLFAAMVTNIVPLGAMAWGWADAETITSRQLMAMAGVIAMVALVQYGAAVKPVVRAQPQPEMAPAGAEA
ncbi:MAG: hypothetical protein B7Z55_04575 [Planctomycetales bacterium 12-60-4]|nr:MAG: hypothetical protein B7Z55_04575 [Planctomycetales bacterium 12-60-4]